MTKRTWQEDHALGEPRPVAYELALSRRKLLANRLEKMWANAALVGDGAAFLLGGRDARSLWLAAGRTADALDDLARWAGEAAREARAVEVLADEAREVERLAKVRPKLHAEWEGPSSVVLSMERGAA